MHGNRPSPGHVDQVPARIRPLVEIPYGKIDRKRPTKLTVHSYSMCKRAHHELHHSRSHR
jgi:hypothetical protein